MRKITPFCPYDIVALLHCCKSCSLLEFQKVCNYFRENKTSLNSKKSNTLFLKLMRGTKTPKNAILKNNDTVED